MTRQQNNNVHGGVDAGDAPMYATDPMASEGAFQCRRVPEPVYWGARTCGRALHGATCLATEAA